MRGVELPGLRGPFPRFCALRAQVCFSGPFVAGALFRHLFSRVLRPGRSRPRVCRLRKHADGASAVYRPFTRRSHRPCRTRAAQPGLTSGFARLVLVANHGGQSANNSHAVCLDCRACCGQAGEVNTRALAALLNDGAVRAGLTARGAHIPPETWFVAALHNTTTDDVRLFDTGACRRSRTDHVLVAGRECTARGERAPVRREPVAVVVATRRCLQHTAALRRYTHPG
ncbi:hypothetical protein GALL_250970 [mine drainage metagenome]|uniref:Uncharacterized protein n=1 Tax=mine drainage metagenome TaxID=410659 RepID=A0A1J5RAY1_9ZZZZ